MSGEAPVVVVTGASAGVGRAVVREFAKTGARVGMLSRNGERLAKARDEARELGGEALPLVTDVADYDQVEGAADRIERELGPIDVWVNNAMTTIFAPVAEIRPDEFQRATEVTYLGTVYGTMAALKHMRPRNRGTIVQVGSALSYRAIPLQAPYCGAKHAVRGFTDSLRSELMAERSDIKLTMVQLPGLNTPQFSWCRSRLPKHPQPVPPVYQPEVAARAIVWASQHHRREVIVGRMALIAIWGNKLFPGLGDWYLAKTGIESQQMDVPVDRNRPSNLFETVDGDYAAHGIFDEGANDSSLQFQLSKHRGWALAGAALIGVALGGALARR